VAISTAEKNASIRSRWSRGLASPPITTKGSSRVRSLWRGAPPFLFDTERHLARVPRSGPVNRRAGKRACAVWSVVDLRAPIADHACRSRRIDDTTAHLRIDRPGAIGSMLLRVRLEIPRKRAASGVRRSRGGRPAIGSGINIPSVSRIACCRRRYRVMANRAENGRLGACRIVACADGTP